MKRMQPSKTWTLAAGMVRRAVLLSFPAVFVLGMHVGAAAPVATKPAEPKARPAAPPSLSVVGAADIVAIGHAPSVVGLFGVGRRMALWGDWPSQRVTATHDKAEPIDPELLRAVIDLSPDANPGKEAGEKRARDEAIVVAAQTSSKAFARSAAETGDLTFAQLLATPRAFRGKVIHVEGRLKSVQRLQPSEWAAQQGVKDVYEAVLFTDPTDSVAALVIVSELPAGIKTGNNLKYTVAVDGYFFKEHLRKSTTEFRIMPMLIGRTLTVLKKGKPGLDISKAPTLDSSLLGGVKDRTPFPSPARSVEEYWAYLETIVLAARTSPDAFAKSARDNPNVTFAHLHADPAGYRGKVIHLEGILQRVTQVEVPPEIRKRGVTQLYEGWIHGKTLGSNPFFVTFTELPTKLKLKPGEDVKIKAAFDGYFFKKYVYQAEKDKGKEGRYTPMLIGRSILLQDNSSKQRRTTGENVEKASRFTDFAPPLRDHIDPDLLDAVEDKKPIALDAARKPEEFTVWCETVYLAAQTSAAAFAASAEKSGDVTYNRLMRDPAKLRGTVVHVAGRLKRLRVAEAPAYLKERGVDRLYEGWIFGTGWGSKPCCVIFTDLPKGIAIDEEISYPVTFDGYFFKEYRYTAAKDRFDAPYFVGRTIALKKSEAVAWASSFSSYFVIGISVLLGGTLLVVFGLSWSFRRSDRTTRSRLLEARKAALAGEPNSGSRADANPLVDHAVGPEESVGRELDPRRDDGDFLRNGH